MEIQRANVLFKEEQLIKRGLTSRNATQARHFYIKIHKGGHKCFATKEKAK